MQPIKKTIDYKKYFSNELNILLDNMMSSVETENPVSEITTEFFLMYALENEDCMLYKAVNCFLNSFAIDTIHDSFYIKVQDNQLSGLRPGRKIEYSSEFENYLSKSNGEREKLKCNLITSDHILLSILNDAANNTISKIFIENGLTYDTLYEKSVSLHEITEEVSQTGETNQMPGIKIIATSDKPFNPEDIFGQIQTMLPTLVGASPSQSKKASKSQVPYCKNLNKLAELGKIDPIIGREAEIFKIEKIFARRKCNNVVIVGKSGTGKTSLVEGLAKSVVDRTAPISLLNCQFFTLNTTDLLSGTNLRGMFEERVGKVFSELKSIKDSVLFIDDAHTVINDKKNEDFGLIDLISDYISDNAVKIILSTNEKGYKTIQSNSRNLMRRFQKLTIEGTNDEDTLTILKTAKKSYEKYHNVKYGDDILKDCIKLSKRYIPEVSLPSSAIDILDEVGALKKLKIRTNAKVSDDMLKLHMLKEKKGGLVKQDKMDEVKKIDEEIFKLTNDIAISISDIENKAKDNNQITVDDLYEAISQHTDIPVSKINVSEKKVLANISKILKANIIGQDEAITSITNAIKRSKVGLYPSNRPTIVAMLLGPSGTGKTLTAKTLAKEIFGDEKYLVRFDMSEYADKTSVNKLIGSSAGYVGYDNGGLLTEAIRNKKHAVLLIDEIEKADEEVYNLFLQVFDDGFLTDNQGNKVDFKNTIILLTSNVGAKRASTEKSMGFNVDSNTDKRDIITKELKSKFPPEFINRLDNIIYYNELSDDNLKEIIKLELNKLGKRVDNIGYEMSYNDTVVDYIFDKVIKEREYGARPIVRNIQNEIENKLTDFILENDEVKALNVDVVDFNVVVR